MIGRRLSIYPPGVVCRGADCLPGGNLAAEGKLAIKGEIDFRRAGAIARCRAII